MKPVSHLDEADQETLVLICKAMAHPARVRLLLFLAESGTCYFGDLSPIVNLAPSTVAQHVSVLKEAGLIAISAEGQRTCYCVNPERLMEAKRLFQRL